MHMLRKTAGFTLIELMIVVVVISILAAVALPSYQAYMLRGKLVDGTSILADSRVKMEQYFQDKRNYGAAGTTCPITVGASEYFVFSCVITADTFTITAASKAGGISATAGDYTYTLNELNAKSTTKYKGATQTGKACWMIKGTEC